MLFGREYMPEGAGVSPDAPRKKGAARLWEILSRDLDGIFLSGTLALLGRAPAAILVGAALWLGSLPLCRLADVSGAYRTVRHHPACPAGRTGVLVAHLQAGVEAELQKQSGARCGVHPAVGAGGVLLLSYIA